MMMNKEGRVETATQKAIERIFDIHAIRKINDPDVVKRTSEGMVKLMSEAGELLFDQNDRTVFDLLLEDGKHIEVLEKMERKMKEHLERLSGIMQLPKGMTLGIIEEELKKMDADIKRMEAK